MTAKSKITVGILIVVSIFLVFTADSWMPKGIDITYQGVVLSADNPDFLENTTIHIKGKLFHQNSGKLFRLISPKNTFRGEIVVDYYNFTAEYPLLDVTFKNWINGTYIGSLQYWCYNPEIDTAEIRVLTIMFSNNFENIYITRWEDNEEIAYIFAPAVTLEEAREIEKLFFDDTVN